MQAADATLVSERAKKRGHDQLGTLGSGNHFLEVQEVAEIFNPSVARAFGLEVGMVTIMIHCGSRGLGHQTCTDYVRAMLPQLDTWHIRLPDKELACAPINSQLGKEYYAAMCASANFAWANRHLIGHWVRECFQKVIGPDCIVRTVFMIFLIIWVKKKNIVSMAL